MSVPSTNSISAVHSTTKLVDGGYVITWTNFGATTNADTFAQRFNAAGEKIGGEIFVNTTLIDVQTESEVVALNDGGFVIVWVGAGMVDGLPLAGLFAQRYDVDGAAVGAETRIVAGTITARYFNTVTPVAATLEDGGYVLAWTRHYTSGFLADEVLTQQFNADGSARGTPTQVDPTVTVGQYWYPTIASLTGGGYVISWTHSNDVYGQIFDNAGVKVGEKFMVNTHLPQAQEVSFATGLSDGGFVITWHSTGQNGNDFDDIYAQRFDAAGAKVGSETLVNTYLTNTQRDAKVTALTDGGYVIVWNSYFQDGSGIGCYGQQFDAAGAKVGAEFQINTRTVSLQYMPYAVALAEGGFVVTWYNQDAGKKGEIMQKIFAAVPSIDGTDLADDLEGTAGNDVINGLGGADLLTGNDGDDALDGGAGADTMTGGMGNDTYYVDDVGDKVNEPHGQGTDTVYTSVSYSLFGRAVENLIMLGDGDLSVTANGMNNRLTGNAGNNSFDGGTGGDQMIGGLGDDTYYVDNFYDNVTELHHQGTDTVFASVSYALFGRAVETLTLTGTGNLNGTGNSLNNTLNGTAGNNVLDGGTGGDKMTGGLGDDTYYVDNFFDNVAELHFQGTDTVFSTVSYSLFGRAVEVMTLTGAASINATGNSLANTLTGNGGANVLDGGIGNDLLTGGLGADVFLFNALSGKDTVNDFSGADNDMVNINAYTGGVANAAMVAQVGLNVVITLGGGNTVTVLNAVQADVLSHMVW
ncbi:calcium-binding protein [Asticcacaulis biprosthecium]|uniref:calcium-binding protein n=1 Tax=Asticcacaulis biprosthecium TaxID=76891 RepID=UPI0012F529BA|nr:calcium-binding protein [Asticcacaulis biprosthecium]